jgi:hypothetical protein
VLGATEIASIYDAGAAGKRIVGPFINTPATLPDALGAWEMISFDARIGNTYTIQSANALNTGA